MSNVKQTDLASAVLTVVQQTYPTASVAFDPLEGLNKTTLTVYVIPDNIEFNIGDSAGRKRVVGLNATKYITVALSKGYEDPGTDGDIAPWAESKELLDTFETMSITVLKTLYSGARITSAEILRADSENLDNRQFFTALLIGFENVC